MEHTLLDLLLGADDLVRSAEAGAETFSENDLASPRY